MFDGKLGPYPHEEFHIKLKDGTKPAVYKNAYKVSYRHETTFKRKLDALCKDNILKYCGWSKRSASTFILPKKNGPVRWVCNFSELNKSLQQQSFPLIQIQDVINRRDKYSFITKLDMSMMFYSFLLDKPSRELCTINTLFGLYRYKRLPMGILISPHLCQ